jgi:hypothetical protein
MFGVTQRVWYHNQEEDRWVSLYLRGIHQLWQEDVMLSPTLGKPEVHTQVSAAGKTGKPATYPVLSGVPKRIEVKEWLLNPPKPPFTIAIAESGQKHILFLAQEGYSRNHFPVQFEMDCLQIDRVAFSDLLAQYEKLLQAGFSKAEIDSGNYRPDRLLANIDIWQIYDAAISKERSSGKPSRLLQLISFVAIKPEYVEPIAKVESAVTATTEPVKVGKNGQLALF